jgi:hypothetical protein
MIAGFRQTNHAVVYYDLVAAIANGDVVTWEYSGGIIVSEADSTPLADVTAQTVTNNVSGGGDPIGDSIRAKAIAYYKLDETPSGARTSSTGVYSLTENTDPVPSDTGKLGLCAKFQDDPNLYFVLESSPTLPGTPTTDIPNGYTSWAWIKCNQAVYILDPQFGNYTVTSLMVMSPTEIGSIQVGPASDGNSMRVFSDTFGVNTGNGLTDIIEQTISINEWHLVFVWYDRDANLGYLQLDNQTPVSHAPWADLVAMSTVLQLISLGTNNGSNSVDTVWWDEIGVSQPLTSDERAYLYNSGAGRALFPAP